MTQSIAKSRIATLKITATPFSYPVNSGYIAGVDEAGRGPLVGAVVAAAVILDHKHPIQGLADSKQLTEKQRIVLYQEITQHALAWGVGRAEAQEIDQLNILQATLLAMQRAIAALTIAPDYVLIDGNRCPVLPMPAQAVVKGDSRVAEISAASIIAKVVRDREMQLLHQHYPEYGFAQHKGYPTQLHLQKLSEFGAIEQHRRSFAPVKRVLNNRIR